MQVTISDDLVLAADLTEADARLALALTLFREDKLTLAQAARLAGLDRLAFQQQLAARRIPVHYGLDELEADLISGDLHRRVLETTGEGQA